MYPFAAVFYIQKHFMYIAQRRPTILIIYGSSTFYRPFKVDFVIYKY